MVWPEGLCHLKIPVTPSGIDPAASRLAQSTAPPMPLKISVFGIVAKLSKKV
jgi:hypothetical protein